MDLISVALATYNGQAYLPAQLASIAARTRRPSEIVVGDDQSSDSTEAILRSFERQTGIPVHFTQNPKRLGSTGNFNAILSRCQGDAIILCDQDDVWAPSRVERSLAELEARPNVGFVFSDGALISRVGDLLPGTLWDVFLPPKHRNQFRQGCGWKTLIKVNGITGATMTIRRSALIGALPIPLGWIHDAWLAVLIDCMHGSFPIPETLISYRIHASQQIGVNSWLPGQILRRIRKQDASFYQADAANFQALAKRLQLLGKMDAAKCAIHKAEFLTYRALIRESLWSGIRSMPVSLARGNYDQYGQGKTQAALDLVAVLLAAADRARKAQAICKI